MSDQILGNSLGPRPFSQRHIGPDDHQVTEMLKKLGLSSLEALMDDAVPGRIRSPPGPWARPGRCGPSSPAGGR